MARTDVVNANTLAMRSLARRVRDIDSETAKINAVLHPLVAGTAPDLTTLNGVGDPRDPATRQALHRAPEQFQLASKLLSVDLSNRGEHSRPRLLRRNLHDA